MKTMATTHGGAAAAGGHRMAGPRLLAAAVISLFGSHAPSAQTTQNVGGVSDPSGQVRGSARVMGMDASYVGVADSADSLQWNPAGLRNVLGLEAGWHHLSGLAGSFGESIIVGVPAGGMGGLGLSLEMLDQGRFELRDGLGNVTGNSDVRTLGGSIGWGLPVMNNVAVGATLRGSRQSVGAFHYDSIAGDAGVLWAVVPSLSVGAAVANLGTSGSSSGLALAVRAGASWVQAFTPSNRLLLAAATEFQPDGLSALSLGAEDVILSRLALRLGYRANFSNQELSGLSGLTAGAGVAFGHLALDYAFLPFGDLGTTHRVSLTFRGIMTPRVTGEVGTAPTAADEASLADVKAAPAARSQDEVAEHMSALKELGFVCGLDRPDVLRVGIDDDKTRFAFDGDRVSAKGRKHLRGLAKILNRYPNSTLHVFGYSDSIGTADVKQDISQRRADGVATALQQMGVSATRFEGVEGRSDSSPIVSNDSDAGRVVNRRVELQIHFHFN